MGVKQVPLKLFLTYLKYLGLEQCGTNGSHSKFNFPRNHPNGQLSRPIIVRLNYKDIPILHISTNLETLGKSKKDFEEWCKGMR